MKTHLTIIGVGITLLGVYMAAHNKPSVPEFVQQRCQAIIGQTMGTPSVDALLALMKNPTKMSAAGVKLACVAEHTTATNMGVVTLYWTDARQVTDSRTGKGWEYGGELSVGILGHYILLCDGHSSPVDAS